MNTTSAATSVTTFDSGSNRLLVVQVRTLKGDLTAETLGKQGAKR